jgi:precorrin-8X/cobalt-precorrin-8 methylmutase
MHDELSYIRDGATIYQHSFRIIRQESDLSRFSKEEEKVVVRMIHACGLTDLTHDIVISPEFVQKSRQALTLGAPIFCDTNMVAHGVTRSRLPANNDVICTLKDPTVQSRAINIQNTRSAAAIDLWKPRISGSIVAIGNAPTALFYLLERLRTDMEPPAAIIGVPVGFVGAAESKEALAEYGRIPYIIVKGRKGGSAIAAAIINALASDAE